MSNFDLHLSALTTEQADRLRELVRQHHARRGESVSVSGDTVHAAPGTRGLFNLAERCRRAEPHTWPEIVERHFDALDNATRAAGSGTGDILRSVYLRLMPDDAIPAEAASSFSYALPVATGLLEVLALDLPDSLRLLDDEDVAGVGLEELRSAGRAHLVGAAVDHDTMRTGSGTTLHAVSGESMYVASKALVLDDLMHSATGRELPEDGALFTVPSRHLLVFHPLEDRNAVDAINDLASFGLGAYQDNPGPLSPRLYWWHKGTITCLTQIDNATMALSVVPPDDLMTILRRLTA
ncbi:hypothetical protein OG705_29480 [Streptomyces sp. NBC_00838]|uniref:hypothetical protein n=1 Tax=Streptomyces sp. NBC_00838 TaxID=2903680 RepID=UPI00386503A3|nr:hypothetical protein OG705_29480 [Streptomyces sp. NBC_00838]